MTKKSITYAGHSAVFIQKENFVVAIDPWLKGNPLCPAELHNPKRIDVIVLSHGHFDHAGDVVRVAQATKAKVCATFELGEILTKEGIPEDQIVSMNKGGTSKVGEVSVTLTNAFHSSSYNTKSGPVYAGEPCGVVLQFKDLTIYHAGDTCLFSDMKLIAELYKPQVALLPIGDSFTMGPRDAAMAAKFVGASVNIPIHYNTFGQLTGTYAEFSEKAGELGCKTIELKPGATWEINL